MRTLTLLFTIVLIFSGCKTNIEGGRYPMDTEKEAKQVDIDSVIDSEVFVPLIDSIKPKQLVVGFKELGILFYDWPENYRLTYDGDFQNDGDAIRLHINHELGKVCTITAKLWNKVNQLAIGESEYTVGGLPAYRTVHPGGRLAYSFETSGDGYGWIVQVTDLDPAFEHWFTTRYSSVVKNEKTDSVVSLISSAFPQQILEAEQLIGITFRMEEYNDGTYPRTKVWMRFTNFASLATTKRIVVEAFGTVVNNTLGKPTFNQGEELILTNTYGGLTTAWVLANEGDNLVFYEKTQDEPSMEDTTNVAGGPHSKQLFVLPVPESPKFRFVGYFPMGE